MPFSLWVERMNSRCSGFDSWQARQRLVMASGFAPVNVYILVLSPPPSTCAAPGPWQPSQPWCEGSLFNVVFQCGVFSQALYTSSWQVLQVSAPTYLEA